MPLENEIKSSMQAVLDHLKKELKSVRTARANPSLVESVMIEVYGTHMRLKEVANITTPEARQILITPYDPSNTGAIRKGIESANLNLQPVTDGNIVRITIPPMDENMRKEVAKQCKKKVEDSKVAVREVRRKYNDLVRQQKSDGELSEDQMKRYEKIIQEMTDKYCKEGELAYTEKEKEIMSI